MILSVLTEHIVNLLASACIVNHKSGSLSTTEQFVLNYLIIWPPSIMQCEDFFRDAQVITYLRDPHCERIWKFLTIHHSFVVVAALKALDALLDAEIVPDFAIWQDPRDHWFTYPNTNLLAKSH